MSVHLGGLVVDDVTNIDVSISCEHFGTWTERKSRLNPGEIRSMTLRVACVANSLLSDRRVVVLHFVFFLKIPDD